MRVGVVVEWDSSINEMVNVEKKRKSMGKGGVDEGIGDERFSQCTSGRRDT